MAILSNRLYIVHVQQIEEANSHIYGIVPQEWFVVTPVVIHSPTPTFSTPFTQKTLRLTGDTGSCARPPAMARRLVYKYLTGATTTQLDLNASNISLNRLEVFQSTSPYTKHPIPSQRLQWPPPNIRLPLNRKSLPACINSMQKVDPPKWLSPTILKPHPHIVIGPTVNRRLIQPRTQRLGPLLHAKKIALQI
jgi:hypothetical protein